MLLDSTDGSSSGEQLLLFQEEAKEVLSRPPLTTKEKLDRVVAALRNYGKSSAWSLKVAEKDSSLQDFLLTRTSGSILWLATHALRSEVEIDSTIGSLLSHLDVSPDSPHLTAFKAFFFRVPGALISGDEAADWFTSLM